MFRGGIDREVRIAKARHDRPGIDDSPGAGPGQQRGQRARELERRSDVDVEPALPSRVVELGKRRDRADPGIVNQNVEPVARRRDYRRNPFVGCQIDIDVDPGAIDRDDLCPVGAQSFCGRCADARRRSGHDRAASSQPAGHASLSPVAIFRIILPSLVPLNRRMKAGSAWSIPSSICSSNTSFPSASHWPIAAAPSPKRGT
jgi:hypothetical protein